MSKRLLFITYEFPPKGGTQSQHVVGLACGLAGVGWDVTVLTVADPPASLVDTVLLSEAESQVRIERAWSFEPTRLVQAIKRGQPDVPGGAGAPQPTGARGVTTAPRWMIRLVQAFFTPDEKRGWTPWALREARRLDAETPFDAIVSSGPPFTAHHVARLLARDLGIPWLADLRDPVVGGYFFRPFTPLNGWLLQRFERRLALGAGAVITATDQIREGVASRVPEALDRLRTVPNGFDPAHFAGPPPAPEPGFTISYVGAFQASIRSDVFLEAIASLRERDPGFAGDVRIRFVGPLDDETAEAIQRTGTADIVERTGFVSHAEAITAMRASTVDLLVLGPEPEAKGIQTSKLPEYLAAGRPVLALVPEGGVAADTVCRARAGEVVAPDDVQAVADAIRRMHSQWRSGVLPVPDPAAVAEFDRTVLNRRVDGILRDLVAKGGKR